MYSNGEGDPRMIKGGSCRLLAQLSKPGCPPNTHGDYNAAPEEGETSCAHKWKSAEVVFLDKLPANGKSRQLSQWSFNVFSFELDLKLPEGP